MIKVNDITVVPRKKRQLRSANVSILSSAIYFPRYLPINFAKKKRRKKKKENSNVTN